MKRFYEINSCWFSFCSGWRHYSLITYLIEDSVMNKKILFLLPFLAAGLISQNVSSNTDSFRISYQYDSHGKADRSHNGHRKYETRRSHHNNKAHSGSPRRYDKHRRHHNKAHLRNHVRRHWQQNRKHRKGGHLRRHFYNDHRFSQHRPKYRHGYGYQRYNRHGF